VSKRSWTTDQLVAAVKASTSYRQILGRLNLRQGGGNYAQLKKHIRELGLSAAHFTGQAWRGAKLSRPVARPLGEILTSDSITRAIG
jgi:hypothetical protein